MSSPTPCVPCCTTPQTVNTPGPEGATGTSGTNGVNSFTITTSSFVVPIVTGSVSIAVANSTWMVVGENVFVGNAGYFEITAIADSTHFTGTYLNYTMNTHAGATVNAGTGVSPGGTQPTYASNPLLSGNNLSDVANVQSSLTNLGLNFTPLSVVASGTVYSLTATPALLDFGTTDPSLTLTSAGVYAISAYATFQYTGATFAAIRSLELKLRRTNNTAADIANTNGYFGTPVITTITLTNAITVRTNQVIYTTTNATDIIQLWGSVSVVPSAGSMDASAAGISAVRLFNQTL